MKLVAATLSDEVLFAEVAAIIHEVMGVRPAKITCDARLSEDLGVHGDDGHDLFEALHDRFEMDWTGLDLRVHFGSEGFGPPLPWQMGQSAGYFEPQPVTVAELMDALRAGRWPESQLIPESATRRRRPNVFSWAQFGLLAGVLVLTVVVVIGRALGS